MKIDKDELYRLYLQKVNEIAEECEWVTHFSIKDVVNVISLVIEQNPHIIKANSCNKLNEI